MKQFLNSKITLFIPTEDEGFTKRLLPSVMVESTESLTDGITADICIPLHFKRGLSYVSPDSFNQRKSKQYTVFPGQLLVSGECSSDSPPDDALTILTVSLKTVGSRRLHHLKLRAVSKLPEEDTSYE